MFGDVEGFLGFFIFGLLGSFFFVVAIREEDCAREICIVCRVARGPMEAAAPNDIAQAVGVVTYDL